MKISEENQKRIEKWLGPCPVYGEKARAISIMGGAVVWQVYLSWGFPNGLNETGQSRRCESVDLNEAINEAFMEMVGEATQRIESDIGSHARIHRIMEFASVAKEFA